MSLTATMSATPSTDGLGVKLWRHKLGSYVLSVYDRPLDYVGSGHRFMLRLEDNTGAHYETRYAQTLGGVQRETRDMLDAHGIKL